MPAYLKIENPGEAPEEAFTLLGASTKRGGNNSNVIGKFGTGNKQGIAVCLRHNIKPVIFAGTLRMDFGTREQTVYDGIRTNTWNRVFVKFSGKDRDGTSRSSSEDLGFVLEHGATDWTDIKLALREFVSNALDRAIEEGEVAFEDQYLKDNPINFDDESSYYDKETVGDALNEYRKTATDYKNVTIEVVNENQVRAKAGTTRIFVELTSEVFEFYNNIGKWFLHFSEPESLNTTVLPKRDRNINGRKSAVIYRRGVRVREFMSTNTNSLFDYNLEGLELNESRTVDDWNVQHAAAVAIANADVPVLAKIWQSFVEGNQVWEHGFQTYGLERASTNLAQQEKWKEAFELVAGSNAVISTPEGGKMAARKGYRVINAPQSFIDAAEKYGIMTPSKVLTADDRAGRTIVDALPDAVAACEWAWDICSTYYTTNNKPMPEVKCFRQLIDEGGVQVKGFYRAGVIYINEDTVADSSVLLEWNSLSKDLLMTALEEMTHYITGAADFTYDFQSYLLGIIVGMSKAIDK